MNHAVRPPEWMSITMSAGGNRTPREVVGELLVRRAVRRARERPVEVRPRRPEPRNRLRRVLRDHRDDHDAAVDLLGAELVDEAQEGDLTLVLVSVVSGGDEHGRPVAVPDRRDRDERVGPTGGVRDLRKLQPPDVLPGCEQIDRARHGRLGHASSSHPPGGPCPVPGSVTEASRRCAAGVPLPRSSCRASVAVETCPVPG